MPVVLARTVLGVAFWALVFWASISWLGILGTDTAAPGSDAESVAEEPTGEGLVAGLEDSEPPTRNQAWVQDQLAALKVKTADGALRVTITLSNKTTDELRSRFWDDVADVVETAQQSTVTLDDLVILGLLPTQDDQNRSTAGELGMRVEFHDFRDIDTDTVDTYDTIADALWIHPDLQ